MKLLVTVYSKNCHKNDHAIILNLYAHLQNVFCPVSLYDFSLLTDFD